MEDTIMIPKRFSTLAFVAFAPLLMNLSCVERDEKIKIAPDGAVTIGLKYSGSEEELTEGDAMPSPESGWEVERSVQKKDNEVTVKLTGERRFEPGEELPRSFAAAGDPDRDLYSEFPTEVRVERRRDGIYYYFHRTYMPRRWMYIQHWQDEFIDDTIKKLGDKPIDELTPEEQSQIAEAFAGVEAFKQIEFCRIAIAESHPDLPIEYALMARRALLDYYVQAGENGDLQRVMVMCQSLDDEKQRGACFDREATRILNEAYATYLESLRVDAGFGKRDLAAFERAYERAQGYHRITEQLSGHMFEISVTMPGRIIAHSALEAEFEVDEEEHTSTVKFEFDGKWFRDCPYELIAVSRLDYDTLRKLESRTDDDDR
jgi:hypothetical protein